MPMYNLLEYSKNNSKILQSLCNYYTDKANSEAEGNIESFIPLKIQSFLIIRKVLQEN